jgi:hypothetical protein
VAAVKFKFLAGEVQQLLQPHPTPLTPWIHLCVQLTLQGKSLYLVHNIVLFVPLYHAHINLIGILTTYRINLIKICRRT